MTKKPLDFRDIAYGQLRRRADEICETNPAMSRHQAFARVFAENPTLATRSKTEPAFA
jgi:hypothetical protein